MSSRWSPTGATSPISSTPASHRPRIGYHAGGGPIGGPSGVAPRTAMCIPRRWQMSSAPHGPRLGLVHGWGHGTAPPQAPAVRRRDGLVRLRGGVPRRRMVGRVRLDADRRLSRVRCTRREYPPRRLVVGRWCSWWRRQPWAAPGRGAPTPRRIPAGAVRAPVTAPPRRYPCGHAEPSGRAGSASVGAAAVRGACRITRSARRRPRAERRRRPTDRSRP
jgi:hypothetical protein